MDALGKLLGTDLNLLKVFVALDEARNVTKAATLLGLSQPAISHALNRMRVAFGDPLFVKTAAGMVPTPRAEAASKPLRVALAALEREVHGSQAFSPETLRRTFRVRTTDLLEGLVLPELMRTLASRAPQVNVAFSTTGFALPKAELEAGSCDLAIAGFFGPLPDGFYQQKLVSDHFLCAVRKGHPRLGSRKSVALADFCAERHALIAPGGELSSAMDKALARKKRERFIAVGLSGFNVAGQVLAGSDLLLTAPSLLIRQLAKTIPLSVFEPPFDVPDFTIVQVWHERNHLDPGHKWFRECMKAAVKA